MVYQRKEYKWRDGAEYGVDANIVGGIIEEIEQTNGTVTRELLLDAAADEQSPIHCMFEWDDEKAAQKWRLDQSRKIITALCVTVVETEEKAETFSAFMNIKSGARERAVYMNINSAMQDEETRAVILNRAIRELKSFQEKYAKLEELSKVFAAISEL